MKITFDQIKTQVATVWLSKNEEDSVVPRDVTLRPIPLGGRRKGPPVIKRPLDYVNHLERPVSGAPDWSVGINRVIQVSLVN